MPNEDRAARFLQTDEESCKELDQAPDKSKDSQDAKYFSSSTQWPGVLLHGIVKLAVRQKLVDVHTNSPFTATFSISPRHYTKSQLCCIAVNRISPLTRQIQLLQARFMPTPVKYIRTALGGAIAR